MNKIIVSICMCCFVLSLQAQNVTVQTSKVLKKIARLAEMSQDTNSVRYAHAWSAIRTIEAVYKNTPITKKQDEELAEIVCSALQSKEDKHFIIYVLRAQAVAEDYWAQNDKNE